ncbi:hypothetical protein [Peribacillus sp. SI8-4]|uniref:hypothetical protein n=1 Tax=Peribacillus sp. SI8-4 TaxID=3048009 RepID=UPI0025551A4C|nr:hypothetical protein [Peribacillus sp. SI8-4]
MLNFEKYSHAPSLIVTASGYILIGIVFVSIYRKKTDSPKIWKAFVATIIGSFAFHFTINLAGKDISIPIFPIGVALLSLFLGMRGNLARWQQFRRFAWFGFLANLIFFAFLLLAIPLDGIMYPKDVPSTYMMNVKKATLIATHPNAKELTLNQAKLEKMLDTMTQKRLDSESWYYRILEADGHKEKFPYVLAGTVPAKGGGLKVIIFIEEDGKGVLITPNKGRQVYFRLKESIFNGGVADNG